MVKPRTKLRRIVRVAATMAAIATLAACIVAPRAQRQMVLAQPEPAQPVQQEVVVVVAPPAPLVEVIPVAPYANAVWIAGHWSWLNGRHQWSPGRYERLRPGYRWEPHRWDPGPRGNWVLRGGGWVR